MVLCMYVVIEQNTIQHQSRESWLNTELANQTLTPPYANFIDCCL